MIPIYLFYSMFGFQRVMDLVWAAGDSQSRGFLIGATSGKTTLAGEGLQHQDGHSHLLASTIPNCKSYDPTFAYELAVILREGLKRMHDNQESIFYYITVMNENYTHPKIPEDSEIGVLIFQSTKENAYRNKNIRRALQNQAKTIEQLINDMKINPSILPTDTKPLKGL
jgi:pyruvate dehydrogenase E1 component